MRGAWRVALLVAAGAACGERSGEPDVTDPQLLTTNLPFMYPPALYADRVEGDVALRLYIDSLGLVVPESTSVAEPAAHAAFDSAAVAGAPYLEFQPAQVGASRVGRSVVLPVKFRLPPDSLRRDTLSNRP